VHTGWMYSCQLLDLPIGWLQSALLARNTMKRSAYPWWWSVFIIPRRTTASYLT